MLGRRYILDRHVNWSGTRCDWCGKEAEEGNRGSTRWLCGLCRRLEENAKANGDKMASRTSDPGKK